MNECNIIFDLDGTLINSSESIITSIKAAFKLVCPDMMDLAISNDVIGPSLGKIIDHIAPCLNASKRLEILEAFKADYDSRNCISARPYEGVDTVLGVLTKKKCKLFIATNKRVIPTKKILTHLGWVNKFKAVYSIDSLDLVFEDKASMVQALMEAEDINRENTILIGDSLDDYQASKKNGLKFMQAGWGYGSKSLSLIPCQILNAPLDIVNFL